MPNVNQEAVSGPPPSFVVRRDGVLWRQLDDQILILDVSASRYLRLNGSGATLWRALAAPRTQEELVDELLRRYDVSRADASGDVDEFLARLGRHGLLENRP